MGPSSGETTVFMRHLVLVIYSVWIPDGTKCCKNTVSSPDDGPIVARNMYKLININILRINCARSWFYL